MEQLKHSHWNEQKAPIIVNKFKRSERKSEKEEKQRFDKLFIASDLSTETNGRQSIVSLFSFHFQMVSMFLSFYEFLSRLRSVSLSFTLSLASIENQINKFLASTFKNNNPRSVVSFYYQSNISQVRLSSLIVYCFFMERQMPALQNREREKKERNRRQHHH